jgi:hypothetical protein
MKHQLRRVSCVLGAGALALGVLMVSPAVAASPGSHTCSGTFKAPGELTGTLTGDVVVQGVCQVNAGPAVVNGDVRVEAGSVLAAVWALNDQTHSGTSSLTVNGDVLVGHRGVLLIGCIPQSSPCNDDPNPQSPTLSSHEQISGNVISDHPLGDIVHNTAIGGSVTQTGGGGGINCNPVGFFTHLQSPAYTTYEDSTVGGDVTITGYQSCWQGVARVQVGNDLILTNNHLADPDAIEVVSNHVMGNLICRNNSMVWDSSESAHLFPRIPQPNTVDGQRSGQCVLSSPTRRRGPSGPGPF